MVVNLNMASNREDSINAWLCDTMASVFRHTYTVDVPNNTNREVFCTNSDHLMETFDDCRSTISNEDYAAMMGRVANGMAEYQGGGRILTDDKAPVELLGMQVLDEIIVDELDYYKEMFQSGALRLDSLLG